MIRAAVVLILLVAAVVGGLTLAGEPGQRPRTVERNAGRAHWNNPEALGHRLDPQQVAVEREKHERGQ